MMPRPFYRWKSVWFGVLVLGFLAFCWARSQQEYEGVYWNARDFTAWLGASSGEVSFTWAEIGNTDTSVGFQQFGPPSGVYWFPRAATYISLGSEIVSVAYWFLILLFLIPWSGFLAWRWRRQHNLTKADDTAPAL